MKFVSFIASTMLIVLISQYSVMGAPTMSTEMTNLCSPGFEWVDEQCLPMKLESTTCLTESTTMELETPVTQFDKTIRFGDCPKGMQHGEHGICEPIKSTEPAEVASESTTDSSDSKLTGCPNGAKLGDDGFCPDINDSQTTKAPFDPKKSLDKNGACPPGFEMFQNECLSIASSTKPTSDSDNLIDPKENLVPAGPGDVCPPGTEHAGYELCKEICPTSSSDDKNDETDDRCPDGSKRVNGKCAKKSNSQTTDEPSESTTMIPDEHTTLPSKSTPPTSFPDF